MKRVLFLLASLAACHPHPGGGAPETAPRLVVLVVIDQWPEWSFEAKRPAFHAGFERLVSDGEWHLGHHPSAATLTAPGHALLGTGEPTSRSGILANEWWHRDLGVMLKAVEGEDGKPTSKWLRVPGLGDSIVAAHSGAKAVAVSLKERASILPLGHAGTPIWYDPRATKWTTLGAEPAWLAAWNVSHPVVAREREIWTPIDAVQLAALAGVPDDRPGELGIHGFGAAFPHDPAATGKHIHEALFAMPLGNEVVLETAIGAVEGSGLGTDQTPDLLVVSLSAHDYIGHGWGHESWEMWDSELRLDQQLAHFLDDLDRTVGAGRWAMIVTSDHGASPLPETIGGGRMTHAQIQTAANNAAAAVLGPGQWIDNAHYPNVFFSKAMLAQPKGELDSATKRVIFALRSFPGIERVDRVSSFAGNCDKRTGTAHTLCETFDPERSGDLFYLPAKGWIMMDEDEPAATAHGSMQDYDQLVPLIIIEPGAHKHLPETSPGTEIEMTGVSTMLAHWLGVTPPLALAR